MTAYSAEWLTLREPADAAARAPELVALLRETLPARPLVIHDLGCGTGSMARWLAPRLPGPQHWVLHDHDRALLARAVAHLPPSVSAEARPSDLADSLDLTGASLVTASALLDVLTEAQLRSIVDAVTGARCPALFTISVVGSVRISPPDPLDGGIGASFDAHQVRDGLLGPGAAAAVAAAFRRAGARVVTAASPWRLGPHDAALIEQWLRGWVGAASEQRPALAAHAEHYLGKRLSALAAGTLDVVVGHTDVLALPVRR